MPTCEMCGKEAELYDALVEGIRLNVCEKCSKFGKILKKQIQDPVKTARAEGFGSTAKFSGKEPGVETVELIVSDYGKRVKEKREKMGLKQIELAKNIAEKESLIHKIESGHAEPNVAVAKKLERFLKIRLIKETEIKKTNLKASSGNLTIGDIIDVK